MEQGFRQGSWRVVTSARGPTRRRALAAVPSPSPFQAWGPGGCLPKEGDLRIGKARGCPACGEKGMEPWGPSEGWLTEHHFWHRPHCQRGRASVFGQPCVVNQLLENKELSCFFFNFFLARGVMRGGREAFLEAKKQKEPPPRWGLQQDEGITGRETRRGGENWMKNSY